jgi:hypothetical protein
VRKNSVQHGGYELTADGKRKALVGRQVTHGAWAILRTLRGRATLSSSMLRKLRGFERALARELGADQPEELSLQKQILLSRVVHKALICTKMEEHSMQAEKIIKADGSLIPVLGVHYLAWTNSLRLDLVALGMERSAKELSDAARTVLAEPETDGGIREAKDALHQAQKLLHDHARHKRGGDRGPENAPTQAPSEGGGDR